MLSAPHGVTNEPSEPGVNRSPLNSCVRSSRVHWFPNPGAHHVTTTYPSAVVPAMFVPPQEVTYDVIFPVSTGVPAFALRSSLRQNVSPGAHHSVWMCPSTLSPAMFMPPHD